MNDRVACDSILPLGFSRNSHVLMVGQHNLAKMRDQNTSEKSNQSTIVDVGGGVFITNAQLWMKLDDFKLHTEHMYMQVRVHRASHTQKNSSIEASDILVLGQ